MMSPVRKVEHTAEANAEWSRFAVRNSSRYRIGEVASLLGITPQAVRYYEEEGIINPERNPLSGYRYYSAWDINMLMRIRTYRQQGFSMEEIRDVMREFNPGLTVSYLGEKAQALLRANCLHESTTRRAVRGGGSACRLSKVCCDVPAAHAFLADAARV